MEQQRCSTPKLVYSEFDGGWYFERKDYSGDNRTPARREVSQIFTNSDAAWKSLNENKLRWEWLGDY